jgi:hypothetical protein
MQMLHDWEWANRIVHAVMDCVQARAGSTFGLDYTEVSGQASPSLRAVGIEPVARRDPGGDVGCTPTEKVDLLALGKVLDETVEFSYGRDPFDHLTLRGKKDGHEIVVRFNLEARGREFNLVYNVDTRSIDKTEME